MWRRRIARTSAIVAMAAGGLVVFWNDFRPKRVAVVEPGRIVRGAWQKPGPLLRLIRREHIRTVVTLTAINPDDPKYVEQDRVVRRAGVDWIIVPMRGSRATLEQMAEASDLAADPDRQPVFFHCVGGHHRSSLVHAAYRIRHQGWSAEQAWREVSRLPWARPDAPGDRSDRQLIAAFAAEYGPIGRRKETDHEATNDPMGAPSDARDGPGPRPVRGGPMDRRELRDRASRSRLPLGAALAGLAVEGDPPARH